MHTNFIVAPNHASHIDTGLGQKSTRQRCRRTNRRRRRRRLLVRHEIQTRLYEQLHDAHSHRAHGKSAPISAPRHRNLKRRLQHSDFPRRHAHARRRNPRIQTDHRLSRAQRKNRNSADLYLGNFRSLPERNDDSRAKTASAQKSAQKSADFSNTKNF